MDFSRTPESKNFEDRTGAPWYDPHKLLGNIMLQVQRVVDVGGKQKKLDEIQRERDANPLPPMDWNANMKARVSAPDEKGGRTITRPGQIIPEYVRGDPGIEAAVKELMRRQAKR